ncbi:uncharacterized protein MELLADRAFT_67292 [Melampsora larici-populina 98AG31]|uniref:Uncharacterized protein n=1 Tax=Melampsora larici-populina (strain 98AG31 / pathotype 3-4-7) TaxID=747676 RepID=F4S2V9_MELLP|nr:uncharacterized protein MELLADRAFT_67292 [Melampsora larici-populina 98AG31]EGG01010.1 hypothetical protein MELLADRAFT_67292 [Melampsora larici-populina 98AG31]
MSQSTFHGLYVFGVFEFEEKTSPKNEWRPEWRTYTVSIGCTGANRDHRLLYEIQAKGFGAAQFWLWQDNIYFLRGSFFPSNSSTTSQDQLIFEGSEAILLAQANNFLGETINAVGITGVGVLLKKKTIVEVCCHYLKKNAVTKPCSGLNDKNWTQPQGKTTIAKCIKHSPTPYHGAKRWKVCLGFFGTTHKITLLDEQRQQLHSTPESEATWMIKPHRVQAAIHSVECT